MRRDTVIIGDNRFVLAQGHDIEAVKAATVAALRANGDLVDLVVLGNREVSVLVSPGLAVVFTSEVIGTDAEDSRDTGDLHAPFASLSDYEYM
ncbi:MULTISPECIES: hypothetical protein [Microbacterium]|uniref:Uncharacterized protein n=1 Tax=Microbacterium wangchenii TaxID=2541726 RepID=A0ABX5SMZ6_9MICO|nr:MULTISPECIES: hypothetical protein [Microbacterium]MCK6068219.1 hypothetical protein [Microbacterium sp. EYE_512]QBR87506.1 hypothetical protein E4K62_01635 [Microbacterium wangchenii]TXK15775.1 hypothetical protein FVP99_09735 [Microbacterium wangchenii]